MAVYLFLPLEYSVVFFGNTRGTGAGEEGGAGGTGRRELRGFGDAMFGDFFGCLGGEEVDLLDWDLLEALQGWGARSGLGCAMETTGAEEFEAHFLGALGGEWGFLTTGAVDILVEEAGCALGSLEGDGRCTLGREGGDPGFPKIFLSCTTVEDIRLTLAAALITGSRPTQA
jgi:hypothetical protein